MKLDTVIQPGMTTLPGLPGRYSNTTGQSNSFLGDRRVTATQTGKKTLSRQVRRATATCRAPTILSQALNQAREYHRAGQLLPGLPGGLYKHNRPVQFLPRQPGGIRKHHRINNTLLGFQAGYYGLAGGSNTAVGYGAGLGASGNSFEGTHCWGMTPGSTLALAAGTSAGLADGQNTIGGSDNIIIGYNRDAPAAAVSNFLNLGTRYTETWRPATSA